MDQQEIKQIYDKTMIKRSQLELNYEKEKEEKYQKLFWEYVYDRMYKMLQQIIQLYQMPNISKQQIDNAQKDFSNFLDVINMNTLPEVIDALFLEETRNNKQKQIVETI